MEKVGEFNFISEEYLLDFRGRVTIPMIGNYLMHSASNHASIRGFGLNDMKEKHTAWVLSRLAIEITEYPSMSQPIKVYTWIDEVGRLFTSRCFELIDDTGKSMAFARSIWAAMNLETRRPIPLDIETISIHIADRSCPIERPGKIIPVEGDTNGIPFQIKYSDLDINGHLNSIKYMEHLLDLFEPDMFMQKEVRRFEIAYMSEGKYDMPLTLHKGEAVENKYNMAICHDGKAICRAAVTWTS